MSDVSVTLLLFAKARELAGGRAKIPLTVDTSKGLTFGQLFDTVILQAVPELALIKETSVLAVNDEYIDPEAPCDLKNGDEISVIPPISGG